ncbi:hypothetical protein ACQFX9_16575 [Aliinostoc sp. HNIBRCY26]|uniref:hypothetical protein n=1 Tax=Aliinostoc sp. HNIBRCY26 TaxID=3418997 RepID=UPI003D05F5EA
MNKMQASAWKNGIGKYINYGIRIRKNNRDEFFDRTWKEIKVEIDSETYNFTLTSTFWTTCPEFRDGKEKVIRHWLEKYKALTWTKRKPPKVELVSLGYGKFRLLP